MLVDVWYKGGNEVAFTANVRLPEYAPYEKQLRHAVVFAIQNKIPLNGVRLASADLSFLNLEGISFLGSCLNDVDMTGVRGAGIDLTNAECLRMMCHEADFSNGKLNQTIFSGSDISHANWYSVVAKNAIFDKVDGECANLQSTNFASSRWHNANLNKSYCDNANFIRADLTGAHCNEMSAENAIFDDANLDCVSLSGAHLKEASMRNVSLDTCIFSGHDFRNPFIRERL